MIALDGLELRWQCFFFLCFFEHRFLARLVSSSVEVPTLSSSELVESEGLSALELLSILLKGQVSPSSFAISPNAIPTLLQGAICAVGLDSALNKG